ncbi:hypothetical protein H0V99_01955 [Candidatus Saccharibacteria bacterium]|nr:hypothetical protein [Candidatus Saccharibacteria bacterium]
MTFLNKLLKGTIAQRHQDREAELYRSLIRREAKLGGEIFGPLPEGVRREFFCLDEHTWVWHEEWLDEKNQRQIRTTRYDIRPGGILKAQDGQNYQRISQSESERLLQAIRTYDHRIRTELYAAYI